MKNEQKKVENEMVTIQDSKNKFIEKLSQAIGVQLPAEAGLVRPITIFITFLESKDINFLHQITTKEIIAFKAHVFMHYTLTDSEVIAAGIKSYLYLCASEEWINLNLLNVWDALSKESYVTKGNPDICLN